MAFLRSTAGAAFSAAVHSSGLSLETAQENLRRAVAAGTPLRAGTGSGEIPLLHGPAIHRELQLWVAASVRPAVALEAATGGNGARIRKGEAATLLLVDGNPLQEIAATERISAVSMRGEILDRDALLHQ
jgi:hypothetical protein